MLIASTRCDPLGTTDKGSGRTAFAHNISQTSARRRGGGCDLQRKGCFASFHRVFSAS